MKGKLLQTAGIIGFVIGSIVPTAYAQTTANGPYYATPAWDQKLQCDTLATCPRFIVLANWNNEAVLDRESGLVWQRTAIGPSARNQAVFACWSAATGGRRGWRLPRLDELMTLGDPANPPLPAGQPFSGVFGQSFWTIDLFPPFGALGPGSGTTVFFFAGNPGLGLPPGIFLNPGSFSESRSVLCVRGGQGTPFVQ